MQGKAGTSMLLHPRPITLGVVWGMKPTQVADTEAMRKVHYLD